MAWDSRFAYEVPGKLEIPYRYFAGKRGSEFLTALRDRKLIFASKCSACGRVMLPPRSWCDRCMKPAPEQVPVGPAGTVTAFTVVRYSGAHLPLRPPYVLANILLDGADTALTHLVGEVRPEDAAVGMRVEAVFAAERKSRIGDIAHFRPVAKPAAEKARAAVKAVEKKGAPAAAKAKKPTVKARPVKAAAKPAPARKAKAKKTAAKKAPVRAKKVVAKKPPAKSKPAPKKVVKARGKKAKKPGRKK